MNTSPLSLYIHVPFCVRKCRYCGFYSTPYTAPAGDEYLQAIALEFSLYREELHSRPVSSVYFGGGTPTMLSLEQIAALFSFVRTNVRITADAECTIEANPDSLTHEKLELLRSCGVNRLSIGIQSLSDRLLRFLGRPHTAHQAAEAVGRARSAGFDNIGIDLLYGIPGQSPEEWRATVRECLALGPEHLSAYCLSADEGSHLAGEIASGVLSLPSGDHAAELYDMLVAMLRPAGYDRYEISNFAKPGYECRQNRGYWAGGEYLGLGPSAWSFVGGQRRANAADTTAYIRALRSGQSPVVFTERPDADERAAETVFLSLRTMRGIDLAQFESDHGSDRAGRLRTNSAPLAEKGLLWVSGGSIRLADRGVFIADDLAARLLM